MLENNYQYIFKLLARLWVHVSYRYRLKLYTLFMLMVLSSVSEVFAIGAILPFLGVLVAPDKVFESDSLAPLLKTFHIASSEELLLPITIVFCSTVLFSGFIRILLLWLQFRVAFGLGADISASIFKRTLYQPYSAHISRNSSEVISGITTKSVGIIFSGIYPAIIILSSFLTLIAVFGSLLFIHAPSAIACVLGFGVIYFFVGGLSKSRLKKDGEIVNTQTSKVVQLIQEGLGGIRDVLIDGTQEVYVVNYKSAEDALKRSMANIQILSLFPRYVIESLGIVLVATVAYFLSSDDRGLSNAIPILGALAIGAQRLLPLIQQAYSNWSAVLSGRASVQEAMDLLDQPLPGYLGNVDEGDFIFQKEIYLKDVEFSYGSTPTLKNINLVIPKGAVFGFVGTTGCGKSTLLDIIMGLLRPSEGSVLIDGRNVTSENVHAWQKHIAHVPQSIYLSDATVLENIAFGVPLSEIDHSRVIEAAKKAQIAEVISSLSDGYHTQVGERGVKLSGGQRQRIAIARAIYKGADILIFDEATSALDGETENQVIEQIGKLASELTILIVAHRLTSLRHCTTVVELSDGEIKRTSQYQEVTKNRVD
jgi:ABC-type multidrug transport system fused ATPase/permease subunit